MKINLSKTITRFILLLLFLTTLQYAGEVKGATGQQTAQSEVEGEVRPSIAYVSDDNTVLLLHMDESAWNGTANEVVDSSGQGNHGTAAGDATTTEDGKFGRGGTFDGSGDCVNCGNHSSLKITGAITVEAWIKTSGIGRNIKIVNKGDNRLNQKGYGLTIGRNPYGVVTFMVSGDGAKYTHLDGRTVLTDNKWHHVAGVFSPSAYLKVYVDGKLERATVTNIPAAIYDTPGPLYIGVNRDKGNFEHWFSGTIDEVRISNKARSLAYASCRIIPYLQTPTESSIWVTWKTGSPAESIVPYGKTASLDARTSGDCDAIQPGYFWHKVKLTGLTPDTRYYYQCIAGAEKSEIFSFKTQPAPGSAKGHYRFLVYGDNQCGVEKHKEIVSAVLAKCKELSGDENLRIEDYLNLVISVGDVVRESSVDSYQIEFIEPAVNLCSRVPYMIAVGNHEYIPRKQKAVANFFAHFVQDDLDYKGLRCSEGEEYHAFQAGRAVFVMLNTMTRGRDIQPNWMNSVMAKAETDSSVDWIFAFGHHPPLSEPVPADGKSWIREYVLPYMDRYTKSALYGCGHTHGYQRGGADVHQDIHVVRTGGAGGPLSRWRRPDPRGKPRDYPEVQKSFDVYNYVIVDIDLTNGSFTGRTYSLGHKDKKQNNVLIDSFHKRIRAKKPDRPRAIAPAGTSVNITTSMCFQGSVYSGGDEEMNSSQFQITPNAGIYTNCIVDVKRDFENIFGDSGPPAWTPVDRNNGVDITRLVIDGLAHGFNDGRTYYWRIRYRNKNLQWSDWSEEARFIASNIK